MQNLLNDLKELLKQDNRLMVEDELLKNKIIELALKLDENLIRLLLSHSRLRQHFFADIDGVLVFDKEKFLQFVSNKAFLPDSYTAFSNKIGLTDDGGATYLSRHREVVLAWPYKDCVLEGGQTEEDAKRDEIFWNETLAPDDIDRLLDPKVLINFRRIDADGKHPMTEIADTDNLIIKGNNLLALHSLLPRFRGRVKLIYIDPPYNTGDDSFGYNDRFNHSTWLTFMKNRLEVARDLLRDDGVILIQIDNKELAYLKVLSDEVFGRDNFRNAIIVKKGTKSLQKQFETIQQLNAGYDSILLYSKKTITRMPNLFKELGTELSSSWNNHWRGTDRPTMRFQLFGITPKTGQWRWSRERTYRAVGNYKILIEFIKSNGVTEQELDDSVIDKFYHKYIQQEGILDYKDFELVRLSNTGKPEHYIPARSEILLSENWIDLSVAGRVTNFEHEKNEEILQRILGWLTQENDIVLDFFLGSGTTTAVAHKMGRQYIGIEQLEYGENDSIARLKNVIGGQQSGISKAVGWQGGGSFVTCELMQWNGRCIGQIQATQSAEELQAPWETLQAKAFLSYKVDFDQFDEHAEEFAQLGLADQKRFLLEILDKNQLYVNLSEIDDADYQVSDEDKRLNRQFYRQV